MTYPESLAESPIAPYLHPVHWGNGSYFNDPGADSCYHYIQTATDAHQLTAALGRAHIPRVLDRQLTPGMMFDPGEFRDPGMLFVVDKELALCADTSLRRSTLEAVEPAPITPKRHEDEETVLNFGALLEYRHTAHLASVVGQHLIELSPVVTTVEGVPIHAVRLEATLGPIAVGSVSRTSCGESDSETLARFNRIDVLRIPTRDELVAARARAAFQN